MIAPPTQPQRFISTRGGIAPLDLARAVLVGPADDGGLLVPTRIVPFSPPELDELADLDWPAVATAVGHRLLGADLSAGELSALVRDALDFPIPLVALDPPVDGAKDLRVLELFHGPTLAFKDVGARFMARLLAWARPRVADDPRELTILVATSGDTGSAVAQAFLGVEGFRVVVLFPEGQVSEAQQRLFTTLGGNTASYAVDGAFDDCQRMVRAAFADEELRRRVPLGSANSINVARLLPQTFYYFWARNQLAPEDRLRPLVVCTPSGNFGNLTAGLLARRLGLPVQRFVAATNANDVVPEFLAGGAYAPRASVPTLANAMDVGAPSNFERMRWLEGDDEGLRRAVTGVRHGDDEVLAAIARVRRDHGMLLDPHTAIAFLGAEAALDDPALADAVGVFLATAHPAKFREVVERATGEPVDLPPALRDALGREERFERLPPEPSALREALLAEA